MTAVFARFAGCLFALSAAGLVFPGSCTMGGVFWGSILLTVFYVLLRPLMQVLILPFNLFAYADYRCAVLPLGVGLDRRAFTGILTVSGCGVAYQPGAPAVFRLEKAEAAPHWAYRACIANGAVRSRKASVCKP